MTARARPLVAAMLAVALTGCAAPLTRDADATARTIARLGAVPIPTPVPATPMPASPGHAQLTAIGSTIDAHAPDFGSALVTALGPQTDAPRGRSSPEDPVSGWIAIVATAAADSVILSADEFSCRDQVGHDIVLRPAGPPSIIAGPARPARLVLAGRFNPGNAQLTWWHDGQVLAVWVFSVEPD
jgi:hypothetical protein